MIKASELLKLLDKQKRKCALTGQELKPENVAVDHIIPVCDGGSHEIANLQLVLKHVNAAKHTMSQDAFIEMCKQVVALHGC